MSPLNHGTIVVFDSGHFQEAIRFCSARAENARWTVLCAYRQVRELDLPRGARIDVVNLFERYPYRPAAIAGRAHDIITSFFHDVLIGTEPLYLSPNMNGVPLLGVKDNDLMIYTMIPLITTIDTALRYLTDEGVKYATIVLDRMDIISIPEWPTAERLLDRDVMYSPLFAQAAVLMGLKIGCAGLVSAKKGQLKHRVREMALFAWRTALLMKRGWIWRDSHNVPHSPNNVALAVRSKSHILEIEELAIQWQQKGPLAPLFLQDDSFTKEDCLTYLRSRPELAYVCIHRFLRLRDLLNAFAAYLKYRLIDVHRVSSKSSPNPLSAPLDQVLSSPAFRTALAISLADSILSGSLNVLELSRLHASIGFRTMVVFSTLDQWGHISAYLGRTLNYRTISIQNFGLTPLPYPTPASVYDVHIAFDHVERDRLIAVGCPPEKIRALGGILFSQMRDRVALEERRSQTRSKLGIDPQARVLLVGTQSFKDNSSAENANTVGALFQVVQARPGTIGWVKIHPYEKLEHYSKWIQRAKDQTLPIQFFSAETDIRDLMAACDLYVTRFSTTALLAVMLRKPVLSILTPHEEREILDDIEFFRSGIIPVYTDLEEANRVILSLLDSEQAHACVRAQQEALERIYGTYDDAGAERIREEIEAMTLCRVD